MKRLTVLLAFALLAATAAQEPVISPQAIVVNPRPAFDVDVWVDKDPTGDNTPVYRVGEEIRISVRVSEDAYVYLFNVRVDGEIVQILPNRHDEAGGDNFLRAGETRTFPPEGAAYVFNVAPPRGLDKVIALASKRELSTRELADFREDPNFATGAMEEEQFARTLAIVVRPVPQDEWVTDTALFYVGQRPARQEFGTLQIRSTPSDAEAFVDGEFVGYTPVDFGTRAGERQVRIEHSGYRTFETTVSLEGGEVRRVSATLSEVPRRGSLLISGNVGGAQVFLDGAAVGRLADGSGELHVRDLNAGEYRLRVTAPDFESVEKTVRIRAGERTFAQVRLSRVVREPTPDDVIFARLQLRMYPDASIRRLQEEPDKLEVEFETGDNLDAVYEFFHRQLEGWRRVSLDFRPNRVTAEYRRGAAEVELELRQRGRSGRVDLTVEVDD